MKTLLFFLFFSLCFFFSSRRRHTRSLRDWSSDVCSSDLEMGAIRIKIGAFSERIRREILKNDVPLGRLLRDGGVDYESRPKVFLAVEPNPEMMGVFWMRESRTLYGRRTEMMQDGAKIGDIVEVLPLV